MSSEWSIELPPVAKTGKLCWAVEIETKTLAVQEPRSFRVRLSVEGPVSAAEELKLHSGGEEEAWKELKLDWPWSESWLLSACLGRQESSGST